MLEEALRYPWQGEEKAKTVGIGGGLMAVATFFGILLLPLLALFPVYGYLVRTIRHVRAGEELPPTFEDMGDLFGDGLMVFVIGLAYSIVPSIMYAFVFFGWFVAIAGASQSNSGALAAILTLVFFGLALVAFVLTLLVAYLLPAGMYEYARTDSLGAAFKLGELRSLAMTKDYAVGWLVGFAVIFIGSLAVNFLSLVLIGLLLAPWITFYTYVGATYAVTHAAMDARGEEPGEGLETDTSSGGDAPAADPA